jgi:hypothetical protein
MSRVLRSSVLCLALLLGPSIARAAEGEHVRVVVDVSMLGEEEASFVDAISPGLRAALEGAGYVLDDDIVSADATLRVRVRYFNEGNLDYQIDVDISAGEQLARLDTIACPQCFERDIVAKVEEKHEMILAGLARMLAKANEPAPSERPQQPNTNEQPEASAKPKPIGALGGVGIGVAVLGVGTLVAGGIELGRGKIFDDRSTGLETDSTFVDHRPVGGALLGVGAVVLAAGITMIVVDVVRAKKRRGSAGVAVPLLGPSIVGLGFTGQF